MRTFQKAASMSTPWVSCSYWHPGRRCDVIRESDYLRGKADGPCEKGKKGTYHRTLTIT